MNFNHPISHEYATPAAEIAKTLDSRVSEDDPGDSENPANREKESSLSGLLNSRADIMRTKLDVLASEIHERLRLRRSNIDRLYFDKATITTMLHKMLYHSFEPSHRAALYARRLDIEKERRAEDVECWRDVVMVMRDFLMAWEVSEEAKSEAQFLKHVGRRT